MQIENWEEYRREMAMLCESFDRKHTKEIDDAYWSALAKMQFRDFKRAAAFAREKAGQEGLDRFPKPGKFWSLLDEARRVDRPRNQPIEVKRMSRDEHLAHLRRAAISVAKRETMPMFKGTISRNVPDYCQLEYDQKWREWDESLGQMTDDYWLSRAKELMKQWDKSTPGDIDFGGVIKGFD